MDIELDYYKEGYPCNVIKEDVPLPLKDSTDSLNVGDQSIPVKVGHKKLHSCPVCQGHAVVVKRHVMRYHFPKLLDVKHVEDSVLLSVYREILSFLCRELGLVDCLALAMHVKEKSLCTVQPHVIDKNVTLVSEKLVDEIKGISQSDLQELLHWRTVANILMVLSPDRVILFREIEGVGFDGSNNEVQGCDSHFHPEMLLKKYRVSNLKQIDSKVGEPLTMGCLIGNLCFPNKWVCHSEIQDSRLWLAFGFHPRLVTSFESEHYHILDRLLKGNRVVGLGEVGLDYTHAENTWGPKG